MGRQLVTMGIGVGSMSWRKGRFRDGLMLLVRQRIFQGVMTGVFQVSFTIHARPGFHCVFFSLFFFGDACLGDIPSNQLPRYKTNGYRWTDRLEKQVIIITGISRGKTDGEKQGTPRKYLYRDAQSRHTQIWRRDNHSKNKYISKSRKCGRHRNRDGHQRGSRKLSIWRRKNRNLKKSMQPCNPLSINNGQRLNATCSKPPLSRNVCRQQVLLSR